MRSIQATIGFLLVLLLLSVGDQWVGHEAQAAALADVHLSRAWIVALALGNWFRRSLLFIAPGGFLLAAGIGALVSRRTTLAEERRLLLYWLLLSVPGLLLPAATMHNAWVSAEVAIVFVVLGLGQPVASVIVATHLQLRVSTASGARVAAVSGVLWLVTPPLVILPCLWVWWQCGRVLAKERTDAVGSSLA